MNASKDPNLKDSYSREFEIKMGELGIHPDDWTEYEE